MNRTEVVKQAVKDTRTTRGTRRARPVSGRNGRTFFQGAADRQIAEIERTFTLRYEW